MKTLLDYFMPSNRKIFPMQIITLIVAIVLVCFLLISPSDLMTLLMKVYLAITFGWIGCAYPFMMGDMRKKLPFSAIGPALSCLAATILFIVDIFIGKTLYEFLPVSWRLDISRFMMVWGWFLYPITGLLMGHRYPRLPLFGVVLCPTTIFAIGFLTGVMPNPIEKSILILLSATAVMAAIRAAIRGYCGERIYEDFVLLAADELFPFFKPRPEGQGR